MCVYGAGWQWTAPHIKYAFTTYLFTDDFNDTKEGLVIIYYYMLTGIQWAK